MKLTFKTEIVSILLIILAVAASFYFYANFPEQVATHWNFAGEPDSYSSKAFGAFFFPGLIIGLYLLFLVLPKIDPKKDRYLEFAKTYHIFKGILIFFFVAIYFIASLAGIGYDVNMNLVMPLIVGFLFILLGNYMGKIKPNWFMGIRTPWTLSSETVWNKTHRLGGKMFMIVGLLFMLSSFFTNNILATWIIVLVVIMVIITFVYSYILYKNEKK